MSQNWRQLEKNHNGDHTERRFCGINMKAKTFPLSTKNKSEKYRGRRKGKERKGKERKEKQIGKIPWKKERLKKDYKKDLELDG